MFFSEQLLSKEGPLAHVWLAANLERKLTKYQLLTTDITKTSEAIASSSVETHTSQGDLEPLALRLTGTLLYGIVKIYSRKAKYLLDDVSDALMRLKTALKSTNSIILPPLATLIPSVKQVTLQDTVTANDLLWQEPLNLDDTQQMTNDFEELNMSFDNSIEVGRGIAEVDELAGNMDDDIQLDFDLGDAGNHDMSIELGRDLPEGLADESVLPDLTFGGIDEPQAPDFGEFGDFNAGIELDQPATPRSPEQNIVHLESEQQQQLHRKRANKFSESDVVRTSKRRLVVDDVTELTSSQIREQLQHPESVDLSLEESIEQRFNLINKSDFSDKFGSITVTETPVFDIQEDNENLMNELDLGGFPNEQVNTTLNFEEEQGGVGLEFDNLAELPEPPVEEDLQIQQESQQRKDELRETIETMIQTDNETTFTNIVNSSSAEIEYPKRHATNCFFELLVMASSDKIALQQDALFSEIKIISNM